MPVEDVLRNIAYPLLRFGAYSAHSLILGAVPLLLLVLRPSFAGLDAKRRLASAARLEDLLRASLWASALCTALMLLLQAALVSELGTGEVAPDTFSSVLETTFGLWMAIRFPLLGALAVLLVGKVKVWAFRDDAAGADGPGPSLVWWGAWAMLGVGLMASSTFSGHATVGEPKTLSVFNDLVHLVAAAVWFAGIVGLAVVLPVAWRGDKGSRLRLLAPAVVRFSKVALISITIVFVTGAVNSFLHVGRLADLWSTSYGRMLSLKLLFFAAILAFGALNHFVLRHRLTAALERGVRTDEERVFRKVIVFELVLALAIVASTAVLTNLSRTKETTFTPPSGSAVQENPAGAEVRG